MPHLTPPPGLLIKSAADGQRLRAQIRLECEQAKRSAAKTMAKSRALIEEAETVLKRLGRKPG